MLDSDIASLFQVGVKLMNQQMKRNPDRFPEDFRFQLTKEEILRSQFVTSSSWGGRRYLPYVYTEQGIIALAGVLRYGLADKMAAKKQWKRKRKSLMPLFYAQSFCQAESRCIRQKTLL